MKQKTKEKVEGLCHEFYDGSDMNLWPDAFDISEMSVAPPACRFLALFRCFVRAKPFRTVESCKTHAKVASKDTLIFSALG